MIRQDMGELSQQLYEQSRKNGFWNCDPYSAAPSMAPEDLLMGTKLALVMSEAVEALEEYRVNGVTAHFAEELADVVIRVMDICGRYDIDLAAQIAAKMEKNASRPFRHNKRF